MAWRCQRSLSPGRVEDVLTHFQGPLHPHTGNASAICFPFSCNSVPPWVYISPSQLERVSPEWGTWEVSEQRKSRCEKVAAHRKFKKILITSTGCKKVCGLQQSFFGGPGIFAESMFSLRNVIMNNYCFRLQRRVTTPEHTHVALFPNLQEEKKKKKDWSKNPHRFCLKRNMNSQLFQPLGSSSCCLFLSPTQWELKNKRLRTEYCEWDGLSQRITLNVNRLEMKRGAGMDILCW